MKSVAVMTRRFPKNEHGMKVHVNALFFDEASVKSVIGAISIVSPLKIRSTQLGDIGS
jgi:hypothetical protein